MCTDVLHPIKHCFKRWRKSFLFFNSSDEITLISYGEKNTTSKLLLEVSSSWENSLRYILFSPDWNLDILDSFVVHVTRTRTCPCPAQQTFISCMQTKTKNMQSPAYPCSYLSSVCMYEDQIKEKKENTWNSRESASERTLFSHKPFKETEQQSYISIWYGAAHFNARVKQLLSKNFFF